MREGVYGGGLYGEGKYMREATYEGRILLQTNHSRGRWGKVMTIKTCSILKNSNIWET